MLFRSDPRINTPGKKAIFDNLDKNIDLALKVIDVARTKAQMNWRTNAMRKRLLYMAIENVLKDTGYNIDTIMGVLENNSEF